MKVVILTIDEEKLPSARDSLDNTLSNYDLVVVPKGMEEEGNYTTAAGTHTMFLNEKDTEAWLHLTCFFQALSS